MNRTLNPEQQAAIDCRAKDILLLAGAGSGKTETMTSRIARLVSETGDPRSLLAITFTRKAAEEMRRRLAGKIGQWLARLVWMGTFHQVSLRILEDWGHKLGYSPPFTIYTEADRSDICGGIAAESGSRIPKRTLDAALMRLACLGEPPEDIQCAAVIREYQRRMRQWNALDFDLMLTECLRLLAGEPQVLAYYQNRLSHIFVDEYQDTNRQNYRLHEALRGPDTCLFAVGDRCQAIYGFRGSDVSIIDGFAADHPGAAVLPLATNYRSTPEIIAAANRISNRAGGLQLRAHREPGQPPAILGFPDAEAEASAIAAAVSGSGAPPADFAVLYRNHSLAAPIAEALAAAGVPARVVTPEVSFWESPAVRACIARLKCLANPDDDWSCELAAKDDPGAAPLLARAQAESNKTGFPLTAALSVQGWRPIRHDGAAADSSALTTLDLAITEMTSFLRDRGLDSRIAELARLRDKCAEWTAAFEPSSGQPAPSAGAWLEHVAAREQSARAAGSPAVTLCTIHAAKGLEWPSVFLIGCEEGTLPSARATGTGDIEEERRLFYVAITRARDELTITSAAARQSFRRQPVPLAASRFVAEASVKESTSLAGLDERRADETAGD